MHVALRSLAAVGSCAALLAAAAFAADPPAESGPAKYTVKVPGGLAFSEFKGYESWSVIAISQNGGAIAAIVGNPS